MGKKKKYTVTARIWVNVDCVLELDEKEIEVKGEEGTANDAISDRIWNTYCLYDGNARDGKGHEFPVHPDLYSIDIHEVQEATEEMLKDDGYYKIDDPIPPSKD